MNIWQRQQRKNGNNFREITLITVAIPIYEYEYDMIQYENQNNFEI